MRRLILLLVAVLTCISLFSSYGIAKEPPVVVGECTAEEQTRPCPTIKPVTTFNGQVIQPAMAAPCTCNPTGVGFAWSQCEYPGNGGWTEWKGSCVAGTYTKGLRHDCRYLQRLPLNLYYSPYLPDLQYMRSSISSLKSKITGTQSLVLWQ